MCGINSDPAKESSLAPDQPLRLPPTGVRGVSIALACCLALASPAGLGDVPRKQPLSRYAKLWTSSPFTVPPRDEPADVEEENPLQDYVLGGVCAMENGWFVVLINKKEREQRVRIRPNSDNEQGFRVVSVRGGSGFKETRVEISHRGQTGWVEYDEKFLVLKQAVAAPPSGQVRPGPQPGATPGGPPRSETSRFSGNNPDIPSPPGSNGAESTVPSPPTPAAAGGGNSPPPATRPTESSRGGSSNRERGRGGSGRGRSRGR